MASEEELELAKAGIEQLGETGREMIRLAVDSSTAGEAGGLIADELRFRRFKRQIRIIKRAETLVDEAGLSPRAVPLKVLAPLIAWGSLEDDEEMVDRWANLLASASSSRTGFHVVYPDLLRQLEPREARIIDGLFMLEKRGRPVDPQVWRLKSGSWRQLDEVIQLMDAGGKSWVEVDARNIQNLERLGLCTARNGEHFMGRAIRPGYKPELHPALEFKKGMEMRLTTLGLEFSLTCQPPSNLI